MDWTTRAARHNNQLQLQRTALCAAAEPGPVCLAWHVTTQVQVLGPVATPSHHSGHRRSPSCIICTDFWRRAYDAGRNYQLTPKAVIAEIEAEQTLVAANRELIARFEKKIQTTLARVWGSDTEAIVGTQTP